MRALLARLRPCLDQKGNAGSVLVQGAAPAGILEVVDRADTEQSIRLDFFGSGAGDIYELVGFFLRDTFADRPPKPGLHYYLASLRAGTAVEVSHKLTHRPRPAGI